MKQPPPSLAQRSSRSLRNAVMPGQAESQTVSPLLQRARALHACGRWPEAATLYQQALSSRPCHIDTLMLYGTLLCQQGLHENGMALLHRSIELDATRPTAHNSLGIAYAQSGAPEQALAFFTRAIDLDPNFETAYVNLGNALSTLDRHQAALESYDRALALAPHRPETLCNKGNSFAELRRPTDALECYRKAILYDPSYGEAYFDRAVTLLGMGQYTEGWPLYEWRWLTTQRHARRQFTKPLWLGVAASNTAHGGTLKASPSFAQADTISLQDKTVLLHAEQGLGDTLQFCRYVPMVAQLGAKVILEAPRTLARCLDSLSGVDELIVQGEPLPPFDLHCPLLSLPLAFDTTLETIPASAPYLRAKEERCAYWRTKLGPSSKLRVGIAWSGNQAQRNDRRRSMTLEHLKALAHPKIEFHVLQNHIPARDKDLLSALSSSGFYNHAAHLAHFDDTAALAQQMDVVVSVDTSVAHLSGAMNLPTLVMLCYAPDWRWLNDRSDSPWYPSVKLFRQAAPGNWDCVISGVALALKERCKQHSRR